MQLFFDSNDTFFESDLNDDQNEMIFRLTEGKFTEIEALMNSSIKTVYFFYYEKRRQKLNEMIESIRTKEKIDK